MFKLNRKPTHPGDILENEFLEPLCITQSELAKDLNTSFSTVNEIINKKRGVGPEMAIKLARYFGTSEELWLNLQMQFDLYLTNGTVGSRVSTFGNRFRKLTFANGTVGSG